MHDKQMREFVDQSMSAYVVGPSVQCDMYIVTGETETGARGMGALWIKVRDVFVIVLLVREQEDHMHPKFTIPGSITKDRLDLSPGTLGELNKSRAGSSFQFRQQDEVVTRDRRIIASEIIAEPF